MQHRSWLRARVFSFVAAVLVAGFVLLTTTATEPQAKDERPIGKGQTKEYARWLEKRSMLHQAKQVIAKVSGKGVPWKNRFGEPQTEKVVKRASVWLLDYPGSVITKPDQTVIQTWGQPKFWAALRDLGVDLLHHGPVKRAGGIEGKTYTPTQDGWFDRISLHVDPQLGTTQQYRQMVKIAAKHKGLVAGDMVPLHTGTGPDFRLAQLGYRNYAGSYVMVEIKKKDWRLLPKAQSPWGAAHVPIKTAIQLTRMGYLPGLINSNDASKEARSWSGWSATAPIRGADGKTRRWVYLHFFKQGQPVLNWQDPSFNAQKITAGDIVHTVHQLGAKVVRLDAVPFLGIEPKPKSPMTLHYQHPLAITGTNYLAFMVRRFGGWSFQELNVPISTLRKYTRNGPDLSYDFVTRSQVLHALLTEDAFPLRLAFRWLHQSKVPLGTLVHDLQNHDEITYQLVELDHRSDQKIKVHGRSMKIGELRKRMLEQMRERVGGKKAPYNKLYRPQKDGVATTFVGYIAPAIGIEDPYRASEKDVARIRKAHLLLAAANALQPGVFSFSTWDLLGALPVPAKDVKRWIDDGDYRWVNRGGVDVMGDAPNVKKSSFGLPRAKTLYAPLPEQLNNPNSFASRLKRMLAARRHFRIPEGKLLAVPEPSKTQLCILALQLPEHPLAFTVLNYGRKDVREELDLSRFEKLTESKLSNGEWVNILRPDQKLKVGERGKLSIELPALSGTTFVWKSNERKSRR